MPLIILLACSVPYAMERHNSTAHSAALVASTVYLSAPICSQKASVTGRRLP